MSIATSDKIDYLIDLETWWERTEVVVQKRIHAVLEEEERRNSDQRDEANSIDHLQRIESEVGKLAVAEHEQGEAAAAYQRKSAALEKVIAELDERRRAIGFLGDEITVLENKQQKHRSDYLRYLGAKPLADERSSREIELSARREQEGRAAAELRACESALAELSRCFDEAALNAVRREYEGMNCRSGNRIGESGKCAGGKLIGKSFVSGSGRKPASNVTKSICIIQRLAAAS